MKQQIKVKVETPAQRCEICHQTDLFDPNTGSCSRCDHEGALIKQQLANFNSQNINSANGVAQEDNMEKGLKIIFTSVYNFILVSLCLILGFIVGIYAGASIASIITDRNEFGIILGIILGGGLGAFSFTKAAKYIIDKMDMKPCPHCAERIQARAIKCRHCGSNIKQ